MCELCGKVEQVINFNCVLPSFGVVLRADVCIDCMGEDEDDLHTAVRLLKKRAEVRGIVLPTTADNVQLLATRGGR